jgi:hypothetical protein
VSSLNLQGHSFPGFRSRLNQGDKAPLSREAWKDTIAAAYSAENNITARNASEPSKPVGVGHRNAAMFRRCEYFDLVDSER